MFCCCLQDVVPWPTRRRNGILEVEVLGVDPDLSRSCGAHALGMAPALLALAFACGIVIEGQGLEPGCPAQLAGPFLTNRRDGDVSFINVLFIFCGFR